jgi:hypothetical protein
MTAEYHGGRTCSLMLIDSTCRSRASRKNKAESTKFSKTGIFKGKETTTMEKAADEMGGLQLRRRYSADVTNLGSSVTLQRHTEEATPTHKQERAEPSPNASQED